MSSNITYTDILKSLNMEVIDGRLTITRPSIITMPNENIPTINMTTGKGNKINNMFFNKQMISERSKHDIKSLRNTKTNITTNINNRQEKQEDPPQMTREEYLMVRKIEYMNKIREYRRIQEIKSTKLKFLNTENAYLPPIKRGNTNFMFKIQK